jgi:predicted GNAT family acetyltransferase
MKLTKNAAENRYELHIDGVLIGVADYYQNGSSVVIPHTEINPSHGGQGLGGQLVGFALDDIRAQGMHVVPACPFVGVYIRRNPDYADLL